MRNVTIGVASFAHLTHVDAGTHSGQIRLFAMRLLQAQRKGDRRTRCFEGQETTVTGPVDYPPGCGSGECADERTMARDQIPYPLVSKPGFQRGRVREVGEDQRQDA